MPRAVIYARYSSDNQREASIEDQVRLCRERAEREGWSVVNIYTDHAVSGASLMRPGIQQLMHDALEGKADIVLSEALDRISRDQEDIAGIYKRMQFVGVNIVTLSEGEISNLHIGLKGTMNALFLKDLADKTRRGLRGRIEKGKSGGGNSFGYDVLKRIGEDGEYARGERRINEEQAAIVRGIFTDYVRGISPRAIAMALNQQGIAAPTGGAWGASTIYGNRERGTGILNNELYIGKLVWNRLRYMKDPETGKRVSRPNPESALVRQDVPELRIIDQALWDRVKDMQGEYNKKDTPLWTKNRPKSLFSGLMKCGCCGGGFTLLSGDRIGCATSRNKGTCDNRRTMKRDELEGAVLDALKDHLMEPALCEEFCKTYTARINEIRIRHNASIAGYRAELAKVERERQQIVKSICDGVPGEVVRDRAIYVQRRREELEALLDSTKEAPVLFHPNMASRYHQEIQGLLASLRDPNAYAEAGRILRSLVDKIILTPREDKTGLTVDLVGDLAGILTIATNRGRLTVEGELSKLQPVHENGDVGDDPENAKTADFCGILAVVAGDRSGRSYTSHPKSPGRGDLWDVEAMVAGTGFEPVTFRL
jgi:site-specific DNA recombinase